MASVTDAKNSFGSYQGNVGGNVHLGDIIINTVPIDIITKALAGLHLTSTPAQLVSDTLINPRKERELEESLALLLECIRQGFVEAEKAEQKDVILFIGNTGAGKSTTINYLCGCTMELVSPDALDPPVDSIDDFVVIVKPPEQGGVKKEVMSIGHTKESKTFMPQIEPHHESAYVDCPGFLDNRGVEINIANAVNIKSVIKQAASLKVVILINYHSLKAERGRGLSEMLQISYSLFGSEPGLLAAKESLFIGVTNAPPATSITRIKNFIIKDSPTLQKLADRIFTYDPLDRDITGAWKRKQFLEALATLKPVAEHTRIFSTVLTQSDEDKLLTLSEQIGHKVHQALIHQDYKTASSHHFHLKTLSLIDHPTVHRLLAARDRDLENHIHTDLENFRAHCWKEQFSEAQALFKTLKIALAHFEQLKRIIHPEDLQRHYDNCVQQHEDKKQLKNLVQILEAQREEIASLRKALEETHHKKIDDLEKAIQELRAEQTNRLERKQEELKTIQALNPEVLQKALEETEKLKTDYDQRLKIAEQDKTDSVKAYEIKLQAQQKEFEEREAQLQAQITTLKVEQIQKRTLPPEAFGKDAWQTHFGVDVGEEPLLPAEIEQIMESPCPFTQQGKVRETHLLVLIPETIGGKPLTLKLLGEIVQKPAQGPAAKYYKGSYFASHENTPAPASHWALLTRDVIPGSRKKRYDAQQALVQEKPGYQVPTLLDATTAIFMEHVRSGTRLYSDNPWTFTSCQEKNGSYPMVVGGFSAGGLRVNIGSDDEFEHDGVSALRKF